ncbi:hypothetical protein, partial [Citrobacter portucalensis]|uniref:hypothetical protein n=1 Tax=Citrobacter portucalensis TaxID=1639133 RepID=UPI00196B5BE0
PASSPGPCAALRAAASGPALDTDSGRLRVVVAGDSAKRCRKPSRHQFFIHSMATARPTWLRQIVTKEHCA